MRRAWRHLDGARRRRVLAVAPVALAAIVVAVLFGSVLATGGHRRAATSADGGAAVKAGPGPSAGAQTGARPYGTRRPPTPAHKREPPPAAATVGNGNVHQGRQESQPGVASAALLNDRGYQLMNAGRYAQAIPFLRRAVSASPPQRSGLTYAYALFNLGRSLRLAGRPREAIPLLERRLRINDQRETVARELQAARRSARAAPQSH